jgi:ABC-type multidrug transport system fused ATPase/permease subunit
MNLQIKEFLGKIRACLDMLSSKDRRKLYLAATAQSLLGFLDLLGVALIGLVTLLATERIQPKEEAKEENMLLRYLDSEFLGSNNGFLILILTSVLLMILKTVLSILLTRKVIFFLSMKGAYISSRLISKFLSMSISFIRKTNIHETIYSVTRGVELITLQVLSIGVVLFSDVFLLFIILGGLVLIDPITALSLFVVFFTLGFILFRLMHVRAGSLGRENATTNVKSNNRIYEAIVLYREFFVRNRLFFYAKAIEKDRINLAKSSGEITFMPYISKYVLEIGIIAGVVLISSLQIYFNDASKAVATIVVFMTAGVRLTPAVLRIQQSFVQMSWSLGQATSTLALHMDLKKTSELFELPDENHFDHSEFRADVKLSNVCFTHLGEEKILFDNVSINIAAGSFVAFVGPSGSGKSTLADLILGVLQPSSGEVSISGKKPSAAISYWPGAISYVPQDIYVSSGTILENITLGYSSETISRTSALEAATNADLKDFLLSQYHDIDAHVGENGSQLSGGQKQRLSLARALYSRPKLIILDEATSSLDGSSEARVASSVSNLGDEVTVIMIAHRISSIKSADKIYYIDNGKILGEGTFEELKLMLPSFAEAANLTDA